MSEPRHQQRTYDHRLGETERCAATSVVVRTSEEPAVQAIWRHDVWHRPASDGAGTGVTRTAGTSKHRPGFGPPSACLRHRPARDEVKCSRRASRATRREVVHDCPAGAGEQRGSRLLLTSSGRCWHPDGWAIGVGGAVIGRTWASGSLAANPKALGGVCLTRREVPAKLAAAHAVAREARLHAKPHRPGSLASSKTDCCLCDVASAR